MVPSPGSVVSHTAMPLVQPLARAWVQKLSYSADASPSGSFTKARNRSKADPNPEWEIACYWPVALDIRGSSFGGPLRSPPSAMAPARATTMTTDAPVNNASAPQFS